MYIETIAMICHQANKAYCEACGDKTQKDWADAEEWQRKSAIKGVEFRINNPTAGEDSQHNSWMAEKIQAGWVYGEEKDADKKTHPCLVSFSELPRYQQRKDILFCNVVDALKNKEEGIKEITFGQKLVGINFNPSADDKVGQVKQTFAEQADLVMATQPTESQDKYLWNTIKGDCIRNILHTQMIIVKLLTLKY